MNGRNIRIRTTPGGGDTFLKLKIDQNFDNLEILSLRLSQSQLYRRFCADYGVVVGRVIANDGFGVPNAKVSIFIPLDEDDAQDPIISGLYPFSSPYDIDDDGVRYNLLPDEQQSDNHTVIGTFPSKRKLLDNGTWLEVYEKYYKFTTVTNDSGDYMIFGVPVGPQQIHIDVDVSDIGRLSVIPLSLIRAGYNENLFSEDKESFIASTNLDELAQVQTFNSSLDVRPLWGEEDQCQVGINRVDFNMPLRIQPLAVVFGAVLFDRDRIYIRDDCSPYNFTNPTAGSGTIYLDVRAGACDVRYIVSNSNDTGFEELSSGPTNTDGTFLKSILMNQKPLVTTEFGDLVESENPNIGVPSEAKIRIKITPRDRDAGTNLWRPTAIIPNKHNRFCFNAFDSTMSVIENDFFTIKASRAYTIRQYIPNFGVEGGSDNERTNLRDIVNAGQSLGTRRIPINHVGDDSNFDNYFYNDWMNGSIYLPTLSSNGVQFCNAFGSTKNTTIRIPGTGEISVAGNYNPLNDGCFVRLDKDVDEITNCGYIENEQEYGMLARFDTGVNGSSIGQNPLKSNRMLFATDLVDLGEYVVFRGDVPNLASTLPETSVYPPGTDQDRRVELSQVGIIGIGDDEGRLLDIETRGFLCENFDVDPSHDYVYTATAYGSILIDGTLTEGWKDDFCTLPTDEVEERMTPLHFYFGINPNSSALSRFRNQIL